MSLLFNQMKKAGIELMNDKEFIEEVLKFGDKLFKEFTRRQIEEFIRENPQIFKRGAG